MTNETQTNPEQLAKVEFDEQVDEVLALIDAVVLEIPFDDDPDLMFKLRGKAHIMAAVDMPNLKIDDANQIWFHTADGIELWEDRLRLRMKNEIALMG